MATQLTFTDNSFVGIAPDYFITLAVSGNKTVQDGHIYLQSGINKALYMPRLRVSGNLMQVGWTAEPTAQGGFDITERVLTPEKIMVYTEYNPDQFRDFWQEFAPSPDQLAVDTELLESVRVAMVEELLKDVSTDIAQCIWQGDKGASPAPSYPNDMFVGLISRALADAAVVDVSGATALTAGNVIDEMEKLYNDIPDSIIQHPNLKVFVSNKTGKLYQQALVDISGKGPVPSTSARLGEQDLYGIPVVPLAEMQDDVMFCTYASNDRTSNIHLGVISERNHAEVKSDRKNANSDLFFFKMKFAADTQIANGEEVVLYYGA